MEWVKIDNESELPPYETIIVEDENGWVGQAYYDAINELWALETFNQTNTVYFGKIVRYLILPA